MSVDLERAEGKYRILFEAMAQGVVFQSQDGQITFVNHAAERILGFSREELLGRTSMDPGWGAVREDGTDLPAHEHPSMVALSKGKPVGEVTMGIFNPKEGAIRWILVSAIPLFKEETIPCEVCTTFTDVTKTRRAQEALKDSEARYRHLFDSIGDAILVMKDATILDCNRRALELFAGRRDEILGRTIYEMTPPTQRDGGESKERLTAKIRDALEGRPQCFEWTHLKFDGSPFGAEVTLSAVHLSGGVRLQAIVRDSAERRRAEAEREELWNQVTQAKKVETVGLLARGVAHDLNNLLSPILAHSEILFLGLRTDDPKYAEIKTIYEATQGAKDLVRRLLAYGRIHSPEMKVLNLNELVSKIETILRRTLREDIQMELFLAPAQVYMKADRAQIEQVIMNMVVNAQDAMPEPGVLSIETATVTLDASYCASHPDVKPGSYAMLAVSDNGQGMDKETLKHIFEPFFTTKEIGKETGIGLATVRGIVTQHEGSISVNSELGKGTTFKIYFPTAHYEPAAVHTPEPVAEPGSAYETIVVVEDNQMVRNTVAALLKEEGYTVIAASDSASCVAALDQHQGPVHLLLTDVVLPGKSGKDLYEDLSIRYPHLKVLYMSGYSDRVIAQSGALEQGAQFIEKPFSVQVLKSKIRQTIGR